MNEMLKVTAYTVPTPVEVNLTIPSMIEALKNSFHFNDDYDSYVEVEKGSLYRFTDISGRGEHYNHKELISDDPNVVEMYKSLMAFEKAYKAYKPN